MGLILVVEDDEGVRSFTARALERDGHSVQTAADGGQGLDMVLANDNGFDLVLSDIRMPVMDGLEMARAIRQARPAQKILMMTGYAHMREEAAETDGTVLGVVDKPFTLKQIRDAVHVALAA